MELRPGARQQFSAFAGTNPVTNGVWSIDEGIAGGEIDASGFFTASSTPGVYHLRVTSPQGTGTTPVVVGLIDAIALSPVLQVLEAADYVVTITLEGGNGKQLRQAQRFSLPVGSAQPEVVIPTNLIRSVIGVDGPFTVKKVELQVEGTDDSYNTDEKLDLGLTGTYPLSSFQRPWVVFDSTPTVLGLDSNSNGLVDLLKVTLNVEVVAGGNYSVSAVLADMDFKEVTMVALSSLPLVPGNNQIVLTFDGKAIRSRGLQGPYQVTGISLKGPVNALGSDLGPINFVLTQFEP